MSLLVALGLLFVIETSTFYFEPIEIDYEPIVMPGKANTGTTRR